MSGSGQGLSLWLRRTSAPSTWKPAKMAVVERDDGRSYGKAVNAPLSPETIAALNERLASGNYPRYIRRKVDD